MWASFIRTQRCRFGLNDVFKCNKTLTYQRILKVVNRYISPSTKITNFDDDIKIANEIEKFINAEINISS